MKLHRWIAFTLVCLLLIIMAACDSAAPTPPPIDRTKPPFEPPNRTQTEAVFQTATSEVMATQMLGTAQAEATLSVQATATAEANAILATATAAARNAEIMTYEYFDPFDSNAFNWREAEEDNTFWQGTITIQDGVYVWQVDAVDESFLTWAYFDPIRDLADFDVALQARRVTGTTHQACYGLLFRIDPDGFGAGAYVLTVCDNGYYKLLYANNETGWEIIEDWTRSDALQQDEWNLLEIQARGADFTILINHQPVTAFTDSRLTGGMVAVLIDMYAREPALFELDFFALQTR